MPTGALNYAVVGYTNRLEEYDQGLFVKEGDGARISNRLPLYKVSLLKLAKSSGDPGRNLRSSSNNGHLFLATTQDDILFCEPLRQNGCLPLWSQPHLPAGDIAASIGLTGRTESNGFLSRYRMKRRVH